MDEVNAMARAGETVGKAVGTGIRSAREGATRAGYAGMDMSRHAAARAEQELASHGISADELQERLAQRATGMSRADIAKKGKRARKRWEKKAEKSRKKLAGNAELARKELAARIEPMPKKRRKWPWVLLVLAGVAAAAVALSKRPEELPVARAEEGSPEHGPNGHHAQSPNGSTAAADAGGTAPLSSDRER